MISKKQLDSNIKKQSEEITKLSSQFQDVYGQINGHDELLETLKNKLTQQLSTFDTYKQDAQKEHSVVKGNLNEIKDVLFKVKDISDADHLTLEQTVQRVATCFDSNEKLETKVEKISHELEDVKSLLISQLNELMKPSPKKASKPKEKEVKETSDEIKSPAKRGRKPKTTE